MDEIPIEIRSGTRSVVFPIEVPIDHIQRVHKYVGHHETSSTNPFEHGSDERAVQIAKSMLMIANRRKTCFNSNYFDDPSWHILLDLLVNEHKGKRVSISSACIGSLAAGTTALRHIEILISKGELTKHADPNDKRRFYLKLADGTYRKLVKLLNQFD